MQMLGKNLFPLQLLSEYSYKGYYMDADGKVYSTKRGGLYMLHGTSTRSGRYYTLNDNSYRADFLERSARAHASFARETGGAVKTDPDVISAKSIGADLGKADRVHAVSLTAGIKAKGRMIGTVQGERLIFSATPAIHLTEQSLRSEMERLAREHPGTKFVSVQVTGSVVAGGVQWE